jgi:hypothetical protein
MARPPVPPVRPGPAAAPAAPGGRPPFNVSQAGWTALRQLRDDILAAKPGPDGSLNVKIPPQHAKEVMQFMQNLKQHGAARGGPGGPPMGGPAMGMGPLPGGPPPKLPPILAGGGPPKPPMPPAVGGEDEGA